MKNISIVYEDEDIIVVEKPAGMPSQEERGASMDMVSYLKNYLVREKKVKGMPYIAVVHRLDKPVGGVMVYAKTPQAAKSLSEQVRNRTMKKEYLAVLTGTLPESRGVLEDEMASDKKSNRSFIVAPTDVSVKDKKHAKLEYEVKQTKVVDGKTYSLVNIHLITGRRHQIRVQMASRNAGLWGDTRYNPDFIGKKGWFDLALFSWHLELNHPRTKKRMSFELPAGKQITAHFPEAAERG